MKQFYSLYYLSLNRLLRSWYIFGFLFLTMLPVVLAIVIRTNPDLMTWLNPKHPWDTSVNIDSNEPTNPDTPPDNSSTTNQTNPTTSPSNSPTPQINPNLPAEFPEPNNSNSPDNPEDNPEKTLEKMIGASKTERSLLDVFIALSYFFLVGSIMLLAMASLGSRLIANEVESGTLQLLFLRPLHRSTIYLAKYLALATSGLIITAPSAILLYIILCAGQYPITVLLGSLLVLLLGILTYSTIFLFMSMFKDGLYIALIYTVFWEIFMGFATERVRNFSVTHYLNSLYPQMTYTAEQLANLPPDMVGLTQAILTLAGVGVFFLLAGLISFQEQEFNFC